MDIQSIHDFLIKQAVELRPSRWRKKKKLYVPLKTVKLLFVLMLKGDIEKLLEAAALVDLDEHGRYVDHLVDEYKKGDHHPTVDNTTSPPKNKTEEVVIDLNIKEEEIPVPDQKE
jgi:hypothetical protein